jgi:hypothetical protein
MGGTPYIGPIETGGGGGMGPVFEGFLLNYRKRAST